MFLSLSFSLPFPFSENKSVKSFLKIKKWATICSCVMFFLGLWLYFWVFLECYFSETVAFSALLYTTGHQSPHPVFPNVPFLPLLPFHHSVRSESYHQYVTITWAADFIHVSLVFPLMCFIVPESNPGTTLPLIVLPPRLLWFMPVSQSYFVIHYLQSLEKF